MGHPRRLALLLLVSAALPGCHKTLRGTVSQPNPLAFPNEILRESEPIVIVTKDMEIMAPRGTNGVGDQLLVPDHMPLHNVAKFTVVSRDRLRFHLQIEHKWREYADVRTWQAYLIDDKGRRFVPVDVDLSSDRHVVLMWDFEQRSVQRNRFGDITHINNDGWRRRNPLGSLSIFRGKGDFVFYAKDLFTSDVKSLTLVLDRGELAFSFTWKFSDEDVGTAADTAAVAARAP